MEAADQLKAKDLVIKSQDILILTHEKPTADSIGSALSLYLGLLQMGKKVSIACPDPITVELSGFIGVDKIKAEVHRKNFVISMDYTEGSIEKVSYNIDGNKFNLVIEPRPGFDTFSSDKVHFLTNGNAADLIITVDTIHLGGLKKLYDNDTEMFTKIPLVNIDHHANNANFGVVNFINPSRATAAELISDMLHELGVTVNEDIATNLLNAVISGTNNFQNPFVKAETFELVAACLRAGGKRFVKRPTDVAPLPEPAIIKPVAPQIVPQKIPVLPVETPEDWLKPKIFKSTSTL